MMGLVDGSKLQWMIGDSLEDPENAIEARQGEAGADNV